MTLINSQTWPADELASWTSQCTNLTLATHVDLEQQGRDLGLGPPGALSQRPATVGRWP